MNLMKKMPLQFLLFLVLSGFTFSCNNKSKEENLQEDSTETGLPDSDSKINNIDNNTQPFDINSISVSDAELGDIPFFNLPNNIIYQNKPIKRDYDEIYFPLTKGSTLEKISGKSFKSYLVEDDKGSSDWSLPYLLKSYDDAIKSVGGVLVFEGEISKEQSDYLKANASYLGEEGSIDYWNEPVKVYVIRKAAGDNIYIQLYGNSASGAIQVVQKEPFKQTITLLKADQIQNDLNEKGKAVLHINFDTDKASLKPDGQEAVAEIAKVLQSNKDLKIEINGYTDNIGTADRNQKLSEARAEAVKNEIIKTGIEAGRLTAKGFGQEVPIADNLTEDGKAQNRRVELVKR